MAQKKMLAEALHVQPFLSWLAIGIRIGKSLPWAPVSRLFKAGLFSPAAADMPNHVRRTTPTCLCETDGRFPFCTSFPCALGWSFLASAVLVVRFALIQYDWQRDRGGMLNVMVNSLVSHLQVCVLSKHMSRVGVAVEHREVAAGDL
jgi:hypothetical protein